MWGRYLGFVGTNWCGILLGITLIAAWAFPAGAQVGTADYDTTYIPLEHTASTVGDSRVYKLGTIMIVESNGGRLVSTVGDSAIIGVSGGFRLSMDSVVTIRSSSTRLTGIRFDTAGAFEGRNGMQSGSTTNMLQIKPAGGSGSGPYISFMVGTSSAVADTIVIDGVCIRSVDTTNVMYDSTTTGSVQLSQIGAPTNTTSLSRLVALPGQAAKLGFGPASRLPDSHQAAGNIINTATGGTAAPDTGKGVVITFLDKKDNLTAFGTAVPKVRALLTLTDAPASGELSGTSITHWYDTRHVALSFDGLSCVKAETIDLEFTLDTFHLNTIASSLTSGITIAPGSAANISASITSKDEYAVDDTKKYNLVVTDKYRNPVNPTWIQAKELTPHGGVFTGTGIKGDSILTGTGSSLGETAFTFDPGNYYVGRDTLVFLARSSSPAAVHYRSILVNPGDLGGIIGDYCATVNGPAIEEKIAAGETIYVRAFLQDSYGNPIDADSKSGITFSVGSVLGKNMALDQSATALTASIEERQYLNYVKSAIGMAIPYRVSTNVRGTMDTVVAACENYNVSISISVRSNLPAVVKMVQAAGSDSSVVASGHTNTLAFCDTIWDSYGNLVDDPGGSVTVGPKHSAYGIGFSTNGLMSFADMPGASERSISDTLYPVAGVVSRSAFSGERTGIDTIKTWPVSNPSYVRASPLWVTPASYCRLALIPGSDTLMSGETEVFRVEKLDVYGNHVDWGLAGHNSRLTSGIVTKPSAGQITSDSSALFADTVTTGHNRGGNVTREYTVVGDTGVASVGGSLVAAFPFTTFAAGADTQKVFVKLTSGGVTAYDTSIVISVRTGEMKGFVASIDPADTVHDAGDSLKVTVTAVDSIGHRLYTYYGGGVTIRLNSTTVSPIATADTTFYFTYVRNHNGIVEIGDTVRSPGAISDTVFNRGLATFWLRKFVAENAANTVSFVSDGFEAATTNGVRFRALPATGSGPDSKWSIEAPEKLSPNASFSFTVIPRDIYYNVDLENQHIVNISSNQTSAMGMGSNPKIVKGPATFHGLLSGAVGNVVIYVFDNANKGIYAQKTILLQAKGDVNDGGTVTAFDAALIIKHVLGDTTLTGIHLTAADVSGDGTVSAYDASLILRYVAGDTTVNSYFMSMVAEGQKSKHMTVSSLPSSGSVALSSVEASGSDGVMNMPVSVTDPQNVYAVELSLNVGSGVDVQGVTANLPQDWQLAYHTANGVLKIAMAGTSPLTSGKIAAIAFKVADQAKSTVTGTATINENASQALGSMEVAAVPTKFGLDQNYPNPFNPTTTIKYQLAKQANVTMNIYSITGQLVRTLVSQNQKAGYYTIMWNGLNNAGEQVGAGVYFCRMEAGDFVEMKKMVLLK